MSEEIKQYIKHLAGCNILNQQGWLAVDQALADTPQKNRDQNYFDYCEKVNHERTVCTCGADKVIQSLSDLSRRASILERLVKLYEELLSIDSRMETLSHIIGLSSITKRKENAEYNDLTVRSINVTQQIAALKKEAGV